MTVKPPGRAEALRVVIDTNVWISAALSREGPPARLVRHVLQYGRPVLSPGTFAEIETRLWHAKFDRYLSMELRRRILHDLNAAALWVEIPPVTAGQKYCRDADDDKFIHTAMVSRASWLITGDRDLLEAPSLPDLRILTPADALQLPDFCT